MVCSRSTALLILLKSSVRCTTRHREVEEVEKRQVGEMGGRLDLAVWVCDMSGACFLFSL